VRWIGALLVALLVASACAGGSDTATPATTVAPLVTQAPTTTVVPTTTATPTTQAPATTVAGPAELAAICTFDESVPKISCHAVGFAQSDQLRWESNVYGHSQGTSYEVELVEEYQLVPEVTVTLQECQGSDCELVTTTIDTSAIAQGVPDSSASTTAPTTTVVPADTVSGPAELAAVCTFDESVPKISCQAVGISEGSKLRWESNVYGWNDRPTYEVELLREDQLVPEVVVTLQQCQGSDCELVTTTIDTSAIAQSSPTVLEPQPSDPEKAGCIERNNVSFSHHAADLDAITGIAPAFVVSGNWHKPNNYNWLSQDTPLYAPADSSNVGLLTWQMTWPDEYGVIQTKTQYSVKLQLSCSISFEFGHVEELAEPFASLAIPVEDTEANLDNRQSTMLQHWKYYTMEVAAGTKVGVAYADNLSGINNGVDIIVINTDRINQFANQDRYQEQGDLKNLLHADCPYHFYPTDMRSQWVALFGIDGVSAANYDCDLATDERGTIAGGWFQSPHDPQNANRLVDWGMAVRINPEGILDIGHLEGRVQALTDDPTFRDPKTVTYGHCFYSSTKDQFAYLEPIGDLEMRAAFGNGSCPVEMPSNYQTFYR